MILLGHKFIPSESLYHVEDIDAIEHTPPSSTLYLEFSQERLDIINHARVNNINFTLKVKNIKELIYASSLGAKYIIVPKNMAKTAQDIAENYLFDAKILVHTDDDKEIEEMALLGIDGLIYPNTIVKVNS
jgi:hypothetical protein